MLSDLVLELHLVSTWFMVGLIWTIQLVHYPSFSRVDRVRFVDFEAFHTRAMARLLPVPAISEIATGAALVWLRPPGVSLVLVLVSGTVLACIWLVTLAVQVPLHSRLAGGYDEHAADRLVSTNLLRTIGWTIRGVLVGLMLVSS